MTKTFSPSDLVVVYCTEGGYREFANPLANAWSFADGGLAAISEEAETQIKQVARDLRLVLSTLTRGGAMDAIAVHDLHADELMSAGHRLASLAHDLLESGRRQAQRRMSANDA